MKYDDIEFEENNRMNSSIRAHLILKQKKPLSQRLALLSEDIQGCDYDYFLKSEYWKVVRFIVLKRDNRKCKKCGSKYHVQVHHLTYEHHFEEHLYLRDLITLCDKCHKKTHGISC